MVLSSNQQAVIMEHILEKVFDQDHDSDLHKSLALNQINSPYDLCMTSDDEIDMLEYPKDKNTLALLARGEIGLLKAFKAFIAFRATKGTAIKDDEWLSITTEEFDAYRISSTHALRSQVPTVGPSSVTKSHAVDYFKRTFKCDKAHYLIFKEDKHWDNWKHSTLATARSHKCEEIFNPTYVPSSCSDKAIFDEKQKFIYSVFEEKLKTDVGKYLVRIH